MTRGVLIVAHDTDIIDYSTLSVISARLAAKHLGVPVSLITDLDTLENLKKSFIPEKEFDQITIVPKPAKGNIRNINNQVSDTFLNTNRHTVWHLTPYDSTLLIDSDLLIFSNKFNNYWDTESSVLICDSMLELTANRLTNTERRIADISPKLKWATAVLFKKNKESETFFNLVGHIKENYTYYADVYDFVPFQYRNDISFTIAKHIMNSFIETTDILPPLLFTLQDEYIVSINGSKIKLLLKDSSILTIEDSDIHVMNKEDIIKFKEYLL
jgi:hypothetical protein